MAGKYLAPHCRFRRCANAAVQHLAARTRRYACCEPSSRTGRLYCLPICEAHHATDQDHPGADGFQRPAERALAYARSLADAYGASLHLLHVIEDPFATGLHMGMVGAPPEGYFEHLDQQSHARLGALLTPDEKKTYSAVIATRMGYAATEILDYVRDHGAIDLIVIATAGRGAVSRLMMGSVTDKIVRTAPCPVLTVHPHDRKGVAEAPQAA